MMEGLRMAFVNSIRLRQHIDFLYQKGSMYRIFNGNLLYHGCVPLDESGNLEGVAFGLRDSLEVARKLGIKIDRTKICGGGAKSPLWKKIIANVMNLKVDVLEVEEGPSMGGANACCCRMRSLSGC